MPAAIERVLHCKLLGWWCHVSREPHMGYRCRYARKMHLKLVIT